MAVRTTAGQLSRNSLRPSPTRSNPVPEGLSQDLCVKGYFTEIGHGARRVGVPEAKFYRDVAAVTGVRTLHSVYAEVDEVTKASVVLTEDVVAQGGTFLDPLLVHGFYLWGITLVVEAPITTALLERLGTAVADHDAFADL